MHPLSGMTVVAVEQAVSPICAGDLGDLGARVIKVENRVGGDFTRGFDDYVHGMSAYFACSTGTRSMSPSTSSTHWAGKSFSASWPRPTCPRGARGDVAKS